MKNRKNFGLILILIIILVIIGLYFYQKSKSRQAPVVEQTNSNQVVETNQNVISYYCTEGIIKAIYGKDDVKLSFKNGEYKTFTHSISADGARYELGTTTFWSKGDNAFVNEGDSQIYTKCVTGTMVISGDVNTYTDTSKTFSFSYPNQFNLYGGDIGYTESWSADPTGFGMLFAQVEIPKTYMPGTNFGDSKFTIGASGDPDAVKNCLTTKNNSESKTEVVINNQKFTKISFSDAGAGNFYDTTSYRIIKNDMCYAVEYTIHSTNIANYPAELGIKEFDKTKVIGALEGIIKSYKFVE